MERPSQEIIPSQTNLKYFPLYTFYEPETFLDNSCPLCEFSGTEQEIRLHYKSKEHSDLLLKKSSIPEKWWDKQPQESEEHCILRNTVACFVGALPRNIKAVFDHGTIWFLGWSSDIKDSAKEKTKRGEKVLGPQHFAHLFGSGKAEFFVSLQMQGYAGCRGFGSYQDFHAFQKFYRSCPQEEAHFYEQIREWQKVREFYDLEQDGEWDSKYISQRFVEARKEYCGLDNPEFQTIDSSNSEKFSVHIIGSCVHKNIFELGKFVRGFVDWLKDHPKHFGIRKFVDACVYRKNGTIRCPGSTKYGSDRRLNCSDPFDETFYVTANQERLRLSWKVSERRKIYLATKPQKEPELKHVPEEKEEQQVFDGYMDALDSFVEKECDGAFEYDRNWDGLDFLTLKRIDGLSNTCPVCSEDEGNQHDRRDAYVYLCKGKLKFGCWKTDKRKHVIANFSKGEENPQEPFPFSADEIYSSEHLHPLEFPEEKDCLVVRSAMGTGKTKSVVDYLSKRPKQRVLILSFRVSLDEELQRKFPGAVLYSDKEAQKDGYISAKILVCQIDSLYRVMGNYDILIIDETSYTLSHLCKFVKNAPDCWDALKNFTRQANSVILMDAFMEDYIVKLFEQLGRKTWCIQNDFLPHENRTSLHIFPSEKDSKKCLFQSLEEGKNVVFVSNCKKEVDAVCELAKTRGIERILKYTSETKKENSGVSVSDWDQYQLVAYTPTISAGISFEKKHFYECHAHFVSTSANAHECSQMLFRARDLSLGKIFVYVKQMPSREPTTRKSVISKLENLDYSSFRACGLKFDRSLRSLKRTAYSELYVQNEVRNNKSKREFLKVLAGLLRSQGVSVTLEKREEDQKAKDISKELSDIADMKEKEKLVEVSISPEISYEEREELLEKKDLSKEETASLRKYAIAEHYHMEQKNVTVEFLETYKKQWTAFRTLCLTLGEKEEVDKRLKEELEREIEKKEKTRKQEGLRRRAYLEKVVLLREVLSDIGFAEWHKEKRIYQKEYTLGMRRALGRMNQDREIFVSLFGTIPAKPEFFLRWLNGQLRYLFGFTIKKTSRAKAFSLTLKFCAVWRFTNKEGEGEIFVPLVTSYQ